MTKILNAYKTAKGLIGHVVVDGENGQFVPLKESDKVGSRGYVVSDVFVPLDAKGYCLFLDTFDEQPTRLVLGSETETASVCNCGSGLSPDDCFVEKDCDIVTPA